MIVSRQLYFTINLEEILCFLQEKMPYLCGFWRFANAYFKEKGREKMNKVLQKGISGVQSVLSGCREKMVDVLTSYEKTANQIDSIGDEFK